MASSTVGSGAAVDPPAVYANPVVCLIRGLLDAVNVVTPIKCIYGSEQIRDDTINVVVMNGIIFLGVMKFFQLVIDPFFSNCPEEEELWSCLLRGYSGDNPPLDERSDTGPSNLIPLHRWFFNLFFVVPLFALSKVVSNFFFQDIADNGYKHIGRVQKGVQTESQKRAKARAAKCRGGSLRAVVMANIADMIFSTVMQLVLVLEIGVIALGPGPCRHVALVYSAWQFSLYCFEYTWINRGWTLNERIAYFESHWIYFLGFGLPYAWLILQLEFFTGAALTQLLFPVFVLTAVNAVPVRSTAITRVPICREARWVTNKLVKLLPAPTPALKTE